MATNAAVVYHQVDRTAGRMAMIDDKRTLIDPETGEEVEGTEPAEAQSRRVTVLGGTVDGLHEFRAHLHPEWVLEPWISCVFLVATGSTAVLALLSAGSEGVTWGSTNSPYPTQAELVAFMLVCGSASVPFLLLLLRFFLRRNRLIRLTSLGMEEVRRIGWRRFTPYTEMTGIEEGSRRGTPYWRIRTHRGPIILGIDIDGCARAIDIVSQRLNVRPPGPDVGAISNVRLSDLARDARPVACSNSSRSWGELAGVGVWLVGGVSFCVAFLCAVCLEGGRIHYEGIAVAVWFCISVFGVPGSVILRTGIAGCRRARIETTEHGLRETNWRGESRFHPWSSIVRLVPNRAYFARTVLTRVGNMDLHVRGENLEDLTHLISKAIAINDAS
jgi:hypothetical protein